MATLPNYNISPTPTTGTTAYGVQPTGTVTLSNGALSNSVNNSSTIASLYPGAYGSVPGQTQLYPNTYDQVSGVVPGLPNMTSGTAANIQSEINGTLPQSVTNQITNAAAEQGVASGTPGSGLQTNNLIQSLGLNAEALTQKGTQDYLSFLTGVGSTQTNPGQAEALSQENAQLAAAPNPQQSAAALAATYATNQAAAQGRIGSGSQSNGQSVGPGGLPWQSATSLTGNSMPTYATAGFSDNPTAGYYTSDGQTTDTSGNYYGGTDMAGNPTDYLGGLTDTTGTSGADSGGN